MGELSTAIVDALHKKTVALLDIEDAAAAATAESGAGAPAAPAAAVEGAAAAAEGQKEDAFEAAYAVRDLLRAVYTLTTHLWHHTCLLT